MMEGVSYSPLLIKFLEVPLQKLYGYEIHIDINSLREITIGRSPDNTIVIPDPTVSRRHAAIYRDGSRIILKDLKSKNGTYIIKGGAAYKINEISLEDRLIVRFGLLTVVEIGLKM